MSLTYFTIIVEIPMAAFFIIDVRTSLDVKLISRLHLTKIANHVAFVFEISVKDCCETYLRLMKPLLKPKHCRA